MHELLASDCCSLFEDAVMYLHDEKPPDGVNGRVSHPICKQRPSSSVIVSNLDLVRQVEIYGVDAWCDFFRLY